MGRIGAAIDRHARTTVVLVVVAAAAVGAGVSYAVTSPSSAKPSATSPSSSKGSGHARGSGKEHGSGGKGGSGHAGSRTQGTITAISGSTWTVRTSSGSTVQVTVGSKTKYGTKKSPASASSFRVGTAVVVVTSGASGSGPQTAKRVKPAKATSS